MKKRYSNEQIAPALRQVDSGAGSGSLPVTFTRFPRHLEG